MTDAQQKDHASPLLTAASADLRRAMHEEALRLRSQVEERITAFEKLASANEKQLDQAAASLKKLAEEMTHEAVAHARREMETAAQAKLAAMRTEFETARVALEAQIAEAESDITAIRQKRDEYASSLKQMRDRLTELEQANGQARLRRELAEARLDEEVQRRVAFEKQLETSRQELVLAKAEAESSRLEAHLALERLRAFERGPAPAPTPAPAPRVQVSTAAVTPFRKPAAVEAAAVAVAPAPPQTESQPADPSADLSDFPVNRQARRIKIQDSDVLVDGVASVLVDISTLGAQVLSPTTLRPNRVVRLMLRTGSGTCTAEGRIVWAQLESSNADVGAQYRAGMQFTALNRTAVTALVNQHGGVQQAAASSSSYR
jgi:hypothetical protein